MPWVPLGRLRRGIQPQIYARRRPCSYRVPVRRADPANLSDSRTGMDLQSGRDTAGSTSTCPLSSRPGHVIGSCVDGYQHCRNLGQRGQRPSALGRRPPGLRSKSRPKSVRSGTRLRLGLPAAAMVQLDIYDLAGRRVAASRGNTVSPAGVIWYRTAGRVRWSRVRRGLPMPPSRRRGADRRVVLLAMMRTAQLRHLLPRITRFPGVAAWLAASTPLRESRGARGLASARGGSAVAVVGCALGVGAPFEVVYRMQPAVQRVGSLFVGVWYRNYRSRVGWGASADGGGVARLAEPSAPDYYANPGDDAVGAATLAATSPRPCLHCISRDTVA